MNLRDICADALKHPNVQAFLRVIREGESSQDDVAYRTQVGGKRLDSLQWHPGEKVFVQRLGVWSTAAGAYQFLHQTWNECVDALGLTDFGPASQDLAAVFLIRRRKALDDVVAGRFEEAVRKCAQEWASLPGSPYGQPTLTMDKALAVYRKWGGTLAGERPVTAPAPAPAPRTDYEGAPPPEPEKDTLMLPILPAIVGPLVSELAAQIPRVAALWKGKSEVAERNVALGTAILQTVGTAIGAPSAEEAVQRVLSDPEAARLAREAVDKEWGKLDEMREASIASARQLYQAQQERIVVWNMVFHEVLALVIITLCAAGMFAAFSWGGLSQSTKDNIVMLALVGGFIGIKEFFYGGSRGSDVKTGALLDRRDGRAT